MTKARIPLFDVRYTMASDADHAAFVMINGMFDYLIDTDDRGEAFHLGLL